jgi:hypothetical protein
MMKDQSFVSLRLKAKSKRDGMDQIETKKKKKKNTHG